MSQELTKISFTLKQYSNMNLSSNILFKKNLKVNRLQFFEILNFEKRKFHSSSKREIFREKRLELMDLRQSDNELTWLADENKKLAGKVASNRRFHTILREFHTSLSVNSRGKESNFKNRKGSARAGGLKDLAANHELDLVAKPQNENTVVEIENINDKDYDFQHLEINEKLKKSLLHDLKFNKMSLVQKLILKTNHQDEATIYQDDLLVRAKTGTGKTIAFLIYAIQNCLALNRMESVFSSRNVPILILSPTRELANQIAAEADKLVKYLGLRVRVSVGGISRSINIRDILQSCDILVATPGRLNDLLLNEPLIRDQLKSLKMLVFDEADLLLEMGFKNQIESILRNIPDHRTTLMFSATLSKQVKDIAGLTLRKGYKHVDCVPRSDVDTHLKVKQSFAIVPTKEQIYLIQDIIAHHKNENPAGKIMIFFPSTNQVIYFTELMNLLKNSGVNCMMIHAKLTQIQRSRVSDQFRKSRSGILVTTDVSARGVDYPNVSLVIQVGMPSNREQYVHRIGRTGRADKEGEAILILSPFEKRYLNLLSMVPINQDLRFNASVSSQNKERVEQVSRAIQRIDEGTRKDTALSFMAFHLTHMNTSGMRKDTIVKAAQDFSQGFLGLQRLPVLSESYAQKMGVLGIPGLETRQYDRPLPTISHGRRSDRFKEQKGNSTYDPKKSKLLQKIRDMEKALG